MEDRVRMMIDLESAERERLRELAARRGVSVNSLIRKAVRAYLARQAGR